MASLAPPRVKVAVVPEPAPDWVLSAVQSAGAEVAPAEEADAVVWHSLGGSGLNEVVTSAARARWVQIAAAGVEWLFDEGTFNPTKVWTCGKGVYGPRVAELALGMLISAFRNLHSHARAHTWAPVEGRNLSGAPIAIIGGGGIGANLVRMLAPLGATTTVFNRSGRPVEGANRTLAIGALEETSGEFQALVLAAPLTAQTHHVVDAELLGALDSECWVVNVSRGQLVDTDALTDALQRGQIGGAALDVTDPEPLPDGHPLWLLPNCLITPHVANYVAADVTPLADRVTQNVERFRQGKELIGVVSANDRY